MTCPRKSKAATTGTGPHWLCFGCDVFADDQNPHDECGPVGRCHPRVCARCRAEKRLDARAEKS